MGWFLLGVVVPGLLALAAYLEHDRLRASSRALEVLAGGLEDGRAELPTPLGAVFVGLPLASVTGRLHGHPVRVGFSRRGRAGVALVDVTVEHPAAGFQVEDWSALDQLGRALGFRIGDGGLVLRGEGRRLLQAREVDAALRRVLALSRVVVRVGLDRTTLRVEFYEETVAPGKLREALEAMVELARRCGRVPLEGKVSAVPRFAWTDGGSQACCPYCKDAIDPTGADMTGCPRCGTVHHTACFEEAGGCTIFGCGARGEGEREAVRVK